MAERKLDLNDFKPNSNKYKEQQEKKVEKVVTKPAVIKKQPLGKKLADVFIAEDAKTVRNYIFLDVIIPKIKDALYDMITGSTGMMLFGDSRGNNARRDTTRTNYVASYRGTTTTAAGRTTTVRNNYTQEKPEYNEVILQSREDAEIVIDTMIELIDKYGQASIADLYEAVGVTGEYTDNKWGWTDLRTAGTRRVREGYLLVLPKAILID